MHLNSPYVVSGLIAIAVNCHDGIRMSTIVPAKSDSDVFLFTIVK